MINPGQVEVAYGEGFADGLKCAISYLVRASERKSALAPYQNAHRALVEAYGAEALAFAAKSLDQRELRLRVGSRPRTWLQMIRRAYKRAWKAWGIAGELHKRASGCVQ